MLKKIRSDDSGIEGYGVSLDPTRSFAAVEWFLPMAVGLGAKILDDDGKAAFNDPAVVKVLEASHALVQDDKVVSPEMVFVGRDDMQQRVEGGKLVFVTGGTHGLAEMRERSGLGDKLSFAPVPAFDADHPTPAVLQGWDLVIPTDAQHPDLAWELIEHWTSPEIQRYQTEHVGYMPGNRMVANDPMFDSPKFVHIKRAFDAINRGTLNFDWPENSGTPERRPLQHGRGGGLGQDVDPRRDSCSRKGLQFRPSMSLSERARRHVGRVAPSEGSGRRPNCGGRGASAPTLVIGNKPG